VVLNLSLGMDIRMNETEIDALIQKHHLGGCTLNGAGKVKAVKTGKYWEIVFAGLPNLKFFMELAKLAKVPLETITCEDEYNGDGCETCGFGGGTTYTVKVPIV